MQTTHDLKPFKNDKSDPNRYFDLLRGIIITKEIDRNKKTTVKNCINLSRKDIPQYMQLKKKYPVINLDTIEKIARETKIKIVVYLKQKHIDPATDPYATKNDSSVIMTVTGKSFHEQENYSLSKLTLVFGTSFLTPQIYNSLKKKMEKCCFVDALKRLEMFSLNEDQFIEEWGNEKVHFLYDEKFVRVFGFGINIWKHIGNYNYKRLTESLSNRKANIIVTDQHAKQGYIHYEDEITVVYDNPYVELLSCTVTKTCFYTTKNANNLAKHEKTCSDKTINDGPTLMFIL